MRNGKSQKILMCGSGKFFEAIFFYKKNMNIGLLLPERECPKCKRKCSLKLRKNVAWPCIPEKYAWRCTKCTKFISVKQGSIRYANERDRRRTQKNRATRKIC